MSDQDILKIQKMVKNSNSLIATPSNINDIYDYKRYRKAHVNDEIYLKALLDNNIVTQILPLVDGRKTKYEALSDETKLVCAIICFLIHSGIELNPFAALYESKNNPELPTKEKQDYLFRVADHLHPQIYADLALGRINDISEADLYSAKKEVDTNNETQKDIRKTSYPVEKDSMFQLIYFNLLRTWLIYKSEENQIQKLDTYLEWHFNNSLSDQVSLIFSMILLSENRLPKMIKKINSTQSTVVLKNISNATWDIFHLTLLLELHHRTGNNTIWFYCTRDQLLIKISDIIFKQTTKEEIHKFITSLYPEKSIGILDSYNEKVANRVNREQHNHSVLSSLANNISDLENKIREQLF